VRAEGEAGEGLAGEASREQPAAWQAGDGAEPLRMQALSQAEPEVRARDASPGVDAAVRPAR
jgi:hypothetical protein